MNLHSPWSKPAWSLADLVRLVLKKEIDKGLGGGARFINWEQKPMANEAFE